jgi:hypothetical protein
MTPQPTTPPAPLPPIPGDPRGNAYEVVTRERALAGILLMDLVSHGSSLVEQVLTVHIRPLDAQLERYRRWQSRDAEKVFELEAARLHVPGSPPEPTPWPCLCCHREGRYHLRADIPLPRTRPESPMAPASDAGPDSGTDRGQA